MYQKTKARSNLSLVLREENIEFARRPSVVAEVVLAVPD